MESSAGSNGSLKDLVAELEAAASQFRAAQQGDPEPAPQPSLDALTRERDEYRAALEEERLKVDRLRRELEQQRRPPTPAETDPAKVMADRPTVELAKVQDDVDWKSKAEQLTAKLRARELELAAAKADLVSLEAETDDGPSTKPRQTQQLFALSRPAHRRRAGRGASGVPSPVHDRRDSPNSAAGVIYA